MYHAQDNTSPGQTATDTSFSTRPDAWFITGHTRSLRDKTASIYVDAVVPAASIDHHDARCGSCDSRHGLWHDPDCLLVVTEHRPRCAWFRNLVARIPEDGDAA